jgi:2-dehydro-3-deoxyphosphogluconate aldolase / (4S)-4-hydroxy-2-oxoglutarate aldolase
MAKHSRLRTLTTMIETGFVPVFYHRDPDVAIRIVAACLDGGARCVEFTNRGDGAHLVFGELKRKYRDIAELYLGAGSIVDPYSASEYIQLGADFIVGPTLSPETARLCNRRKVAYCPGCGSVSEISAAEELGVEICKVFPGGEVGGPGFVSSVLGPMPWSRLMPTGGVSVERENIAAWIKAGASCLGLGSKLITKETVDSGDFDSISDKVRQVALWIREARDGITPI